MLATLDLLCLFRLIALAVQRRNLKTTFYSKVCYINKVQETYSHTTIRALLSISVLGKLYERLSPILPGIGRQHLSIFQLLRKEKIMESTFVTCSLDTSERAKSHPPEHKRNQMIVHLLSFKPLCLALQRSTVLSSAPVPPYAPTEMRDLATLPVRQRLLPLQLHSVRNHLTWLASSVANRLPSVPPFSQASNFD